MTEKKLIGKCPVCSGKLYISELACRDCDVKIRGDFEIPPFSRLDEGEQEFLILFLRSRGSLREVQRELGLSYPTVRSRLNALLAKMGIISAGPTKEEIDDVLDRLESGELSAEDAVQLIKKDEEAKDAEIIRIKEQKAAELAQTKEKEARVKQRHAQVKAKEARLREKTERHKRKHAK